MPYFKTKHKNNVVFVINQKTIDNELMQGILLDLGNSQKIGFDMTFVQNINSPILIKYLLEDKIKLFNLQSEVLTYLALILKDGFLKSHINFSDFKNNKRELIKRHFLIA
ncbi:hypothetical protein IJ425_06665 [bacterium]|nr:hypothetical protein [bacterium]